MISHRLLICAVMAKTFVGATRVSPLRVMLFVGATRASPLRETKFFNKNGKETNNE